MQSGERRVAHDLIQSGNWRGARDPARELEGARDAGNSS